MTFNYATLVALCRAESLLYLKNLHNQQMGSLSLEYQGNIIN